METSSLSSETDIASALRAALGELREAMVSTESGQVRAQYQTLVENKLLINRIETLYRQWMEVNQHAE